MTRLDSGPGSSPAQALRRNDEGIPSEIDKTPAALRHRMLVGTSSTTASLRRTPNSRIPTDNQGLFIVTLSASEESPPDAAREMLRFAQHDCSGEWYDFEKALRKHAGLLTSCGDGRTERGDLCHRPAHSHWKHAEGVAREPLILTNEARDACGGGNSNSSATPDTPLAIPTRFLCKRSAPRRYPRGTMLSSCLLAPYIGPYFWPSNHMELPRSPGA